MNVNDLQLGKVQMTADNASHTLDLVQVAVDGIEDRLHLLSVVGPRTAVESCWAAICSSTSVRFKLFNVDGFYSYLGYSTHKQEGRYYVQRERLGCDMVHATIWDKDPDFLPCVSPDTVWSIIKSNRYTTPVHDSWAERLTEELISARAIKRLDCFQCDAGFLSLTSEQLDQGVIKGLETGELTIPGKETTCL